MRALGMGWMDLAAKRHRRRPASHTLDALHVLADTPHRYDVLSVILPPPDASGQQPPPRLKLLRNFWTEDKFRKRRWEQYRER